MKPITIVPPLYLVSACLAGFCTRFDGKLKPSESCRLALADGIWIPVCPEQLGGLSTPRPAADIVGGDGEDVLAGRAPVINAAGVNVTENFLGGAEQVLALARSQPVTAIFLKAGSPSCGLTPKIGVAAALLLSCGFTVREF